MVRQELFLTRCQQRAPVLLVRPSVTVVLTMDPSVYSHNAAVLTELKHPLLSLPNKKPKQNKKKTQILDTRPGCLAVEPLELDELFPAHLNNGVAHSEECRGALGAQLALRMNSPLPAKSCSPRRALGLFCSVALATARLMAQPGPLCRSLSVGGLARSCRREPRGVQLLLFDRLWSRTRPGSVEVNSVGAGTWRAAAVQ